MIRLGQLAGELKRLTKSLPPPRRDADGFPLVMPLAFWDLICGAKLWEDVSPQDQRDIELIHQRHAIEDAQRNRRSLPGIAYLQRRQQLGLSDVPDSIMATMDVEREYLRLARIPDPTTDEQRATLLLNEGIRLELIRLAGHRHRYWYMAENAMRDIPLSHAEALARLDAGTLRHDCVSVDTLRDYLRLMVIGDRFRNDDKIGVPFTQRIQT